MFALELLAVFILVTGVTAESNWKLPEPATVQHSLKSCQETQPAAATLRCTTHKLGLWNDESGYNARRIAKMFAKHKQTEELIVVIEYCNQKTRQLEQPEVWAYEAYKCATAGTFGHWVREYLTEKKDE